MGATNTATNTTTTTPTWGVSPAELKATARNGPPPLIDGLLPSRAVVTFAGVPGVGKSFTALSWAACVATGDDWFGHRVGAAYRVVYVLGEGWSQFGHRVRAWEEVNGKALPDHLRFVDGAGEGVDLADPVRVEAIIEQLKAVAPGLVVLDTFAMLARIESENDNAQVGRVFSAAHRIVRATGATVVLVHHVSKAAGQVRGATAFRGNADAVIVASTSGKDDDPTFFLSTRGEDDGKQRDMEPVKLYGFEVASPGVLSVRAKASEKGATADAFEEVMKRVAAAQQGQEADASAA